MQIVINYAVILVGRITVLSVGVPQGRSNRSVRFQFKRPWLGLRLGLVLCSAICRCVDGRILCRHWADILACCWHAVCVSTEPAQRHCVKAGLCAVVIRTRHQHRSSPHFPAVIIVGVVGWEPAAPCRAVGSQPARTAAACVFTAACSLWAWGWTSAAVVYCQKQCVLHTILLTLAALTARSTIQQCNACQG